ASAGVRSQQSVQSLTASVQTFADLTGQKAADAQKELAAAMEDPIKGAQDLNDKLGILDATQMEQIRIAAESGDKNKALAILLKAYTDRVVDAQSAGVGLAGNWDTLKQKAQDLWAWLGKVNEQLEIYQTFGLNAPGIEQQLSDQQKAAERRIQFVVPLLMQSAAGMAAVGETPEGQDRAAKEHLTTTIALLQKAIAADRKLNDSEGLKQATAALQDYRRALDTWIPSAEKAHRVASLDAQISEARRKHNKELVDSLTQQRETLQTAGQVMSPSEAAQRAADAGEKGGASVGAGRHGAKGPSVVQEWAEQLHQQEIASNDFFGDQTQKELEFWQGKVGQVKAGSKEALEVQAHVYDAAKALARQDYQDHLADLNAKIEADRDSWSREKSDWDEKLAFIKSKFGEESAEYKNAARDFAAVERQHQDETLRIQEEAGRQQLEALRSHLAAMRQARQELESVSEAVASSGGGSGLLGEVKAAVQVGAMRHQMFVEEMGDAATAHAKEVQFADEKVARLKAAGKEEEKDYQKALDDRLALDQKYADERMQLEAQMRADSIRNILAVQQAYHGYIDGVVGSTVSGFTGMLSDTMTWAQAVRGVYGSLVNVVDQVLSRMLTNWIVTHVLMTAEQRAQIAAQTAIQVAGEGAKVAATVVGSQAQVAATAVGTAEKGAIVGVSNLKEITSHAAAGAAAAYHAMAGIPVVGPVLGAVAAAATFAAIEGFGSMAAFEKGIDMVPQNMPAYLHSGERVFPAADNRKIIAAVERGSGGGGGRNGDVNMTNNFHLAPGTPKSFSQQLQDHASDLKAMVKRMHRDGSFS
ncbi:MAG: phage tail length tape measure family protein, partial [Croceibacterium sp.]